MILCVYIETLTIESLDISMELMNYCVQTPILIINDSMRNINKKHGAFSVDGRLYVNFFH